MKPHERRVCDIYHRIVDLEEEDLFNPTACHICQRPGAIQSRERSTMSIGTHKDMSGRIKNDLPLRSECRPHPLLEEEDVLTWQTEEVVFLEMRTRGGVIRIGRHDIEGYMRAIRAVKPQNLTRMEPKERTVAHGSNGVRPLRSLIPQARPLPASHEQNSDLPCL